MPTTFQLAIALVLATLVDPLPAGDVAVETTWPQWRGPQRDGTFAGPAWPDSLDLKSLKLQWRRELGPSYSGPIVVGDRVFVTETRNERDELVMAFDRRDGTPIWQTVWPGSMSVPFFARANGDWIRSTPIYDEDKLYVAGMRDTLHCIDAATGEVVWKRDFVVELGSDLPSFGCVCSPLIRDQHLYIQAAGALVKLDKQTGRLIWRTANDGGGMMGSAFSSPYLTTIAGREQLLVQTRTHLTGVDPDDGRILWSQEIPAFRGMNIVTPTVHNDAVFTSSYGGRSFLYNIAADSSGKLQPRLAWDNKVQGYMCSPVIIDGHAYLHLRNQRFTCIDLATGETRWTTTPFGKYWSLVVRGDRILALDESGTLRLIRATPEKFDLLAERKVSDQECWAHIAVAGDQVFVRELNGLSVFRWTGTGE